jgi:hypothetical protein
VLILEIANELTHTDNSANYSYVVKVNSQTISYGKVFGHQREHGWKALVLKVLVDAPSESSLTSR